MNSISERIEITLCLLAKNYVLYKAAENQPFSDHIHTFTYANIERHQVNLEQLMKQQAELNARKYAREQKKSKQI